MGSKSPKTFTRADKFIFVRGLLPSLPVDSSKCEIRSEICEVIKSNSSTDDPENRLQFLIARKGLSRMGDQ